MKIAYLHGYGGNNINPKNDWLRTIAEVYDPNIDFHAAFIYRDIKAEIKRFKPDVIIGSSMGGLFAHELAMELNTPAVLFNPALHSIPFEPDMTGQGEKFFLPEMRFVFGKDDELIIPHKTIELIAHEGYNKKNYIVLGHGHQTPLETFKSQISNFIEKYFS